MEHGRLSDMPLAKSDTFPLDLKGHQEGPENGEDDRVRKSAKQIVNPVELPT